MFSGRGNTNEQLSFANTLTYFKLVRSYCFISEVLEMVLKNISKIFKNISELKSGGLDSRL